ncbi:MAG TPA: hypothetical protein IAC98_06190 [Candidatus Cryptobacteroides pullicola]|nr:hypothetical protein [Candidatus Cryptobacteroides pullicola]
MKFSGLSSGNKALVIVNILIFAGYGLFTIADSIVGMSRDETGAFLGILKIVFGVLMIGVGAANVYHIMKQTRNV